LTIFVHRPTTSLLHPLILPLTSGFSLADKLFN
jgi:hypothetical protein